jgi:hypothetical protein
VAAINATPVGTKCLAGHTYISGQIGANYKIRCYKNGTCFLSLVMSGTLPYSETYLSTAATYSSIEIQGTADVSSGTCYTQIESTVNPGFYVQFTLGVAGSSAETVFDTSTINPAYGLVLSALNAYLPASLDAGGTVTVITPAEAYANSALVTWLAPNLPFQYPSVPGAVPTYGRYQCDIQSDFGLIPTDTSSEAVHSSAGIKSNSGNWLLTNSLADPVNPTLTSYYHRVEPDVVALQDGSTYRSGIGSLGSAFSQYQPFWLGFAICLTNNMLALSSPATVSLLDCHTQTTWSGPGPFQFWLDYGQLKFVTRYAYNYTIQSGVTTQYAFTPVANRWEYFSIYGIVDPTPGGTGVFQIYQATGTGSPTMVCNYNGQYGFTKQYPSDPTDNGLFVKQVLYNWTYPWASNLSYMDYYSKGVLLFNNYSGISHARVIQTLRSW